MNTNDEYQQMIDGAFDELVEEVQRDEEATVKIWF